MYAEWTRHLADPKAKEEWAKDVRGSKRILEHLIKLLKEKEVSLDRSELDPKVYDNQPNWAYRQAHKNGERSVLNYLIKLIDLDQQKE